MSIQGKNGTSRREVFSRELIVAFYIFGNDGTLS